MSDMSDHKTTEITAAATGRTAGPDRSAEYAPQRPPGTVGPAVNAFHTGPHNSSPHNPDAYGPEYGAAQDTVAQKLENQKLEKQKLENEAASGEENRY